MTRMFFRISRLALPAAAMLCGCYSMDIAGNPTLHSSGPADGTRKPVEHVLISNYGWYLFNRLPLVCGNATSGDSFPWKFFTDQVNPGVVHDRMMEYAASRNANAEELVANCDEKVFLEIPGSEIPVPIPFLLCYREVQLSAVLAERGNPQGQERTKMETK